MIEEFGEGLHDPQVEGNEKVTPLHNASMIKKSLSPFESGKTKRRVGRLQDVAALLPEKKQLKKKREEFHACVHQLQWTNLSML